MPGGEKLGAVRDHLGCVAGELARRAGQQTHGPLPRAIEGVSDLTHQCTLVQLQPRSALGTREQVDHIRQHPAHRALPGTAPRTARRGPAHRGGVRGPTDTVVNRLAGDTLELVTKGGSFLRGELDDQTSTTLEWNPHDDSSSLFGCFEGTVPGPGLHGRHPLLPPNLRRTACAWLTVDTSPAVSEARYSILPYSGDGRVIE